MSSKRLLEDLPSARFVWQREIMKRGILSKKKGPLLIGGPLA